MRMAVLGIRYFFKFSFLTIVVSFLLMFFFRPHCFRLNQFYFQSSQVSGVRFLFFSNLLKKKRE